MAKIFSGFTPEQLGKIDPSLEGKQSDEQQMIIAANPALSARLGRMASTAQKKMMAQGGVVSGFAAGGTPASQMTQKITGDPTKVTTKADVVSVDPTQVAGGQIAAGTGQAPAQAAQATTTQAAPAAQAQAAPTTQAAQVSTTQAAPAVQKATAGMQGAQGQVSQQAQVQAAQGDPTKLAQLGVQAAQGQAATVQGAPTRTLDQAELVSGSTVDQREVAKTFGTGELKAATVRDEMADLMTDFQGGQTPAWAAGAMRNANAALAARGLGASSMAGMAVVQAAMESALPIAQMDASNKQQVALFKAEQRAKFLGQEFDQNFQTKVMNASKISEIANMNFNAEQQVALENAKMAQTMNLANLSNRQAKVMADVATMAQMDMANLNNRQQAQVQNAQAFLQMDLTNVNNEQQATMFANQARVNSIMSDVAAENAAKQFNATSQNQTDQFFASLGTQVSQFNTEQTNAINRFNAGEANAMSQFQTAQDNAREQFNAQNSLIIAQSNAQWFQSLTTAENAAQNQANRDAAMAANNFTMTAYNNLVQRERDTLAWAWQSAENAKEIDGKIAISKIENASKDKTGSVLSAAAGKFLGAIAEQAAEAIFS